MAAENKRRQNKVASATAQTSKSPIGSESNAVPAGSATWLSRQTAELLGAIEEHRRWIHSGRALALGSAFEVAGRLLAYVAFSVLVYQAFTSFVDARHAVATMPYVVPGQIDSSRAALYNILAAGLVGPIVIIALWIGIGWAYNLATAAANRVLARFVQPLVRPAILFAVVAAFAAFHSAVTQTVASGYLFAKVNIEAATPHQVAITKANEVPDPVVPAATVSADHDPVVPSATVSTGQDLSGEGDVQRLRSMFNGGRPCPKVTQGPELDPEAEIVRPEPGLATNRDCPTEKEKTAPRE